MDRKSATPQEIAAIYGVNAGTLANLRSQGKGAKYYRLGTKIIYFIEDFERWLTSEPVMTADSVHLVEHR